MVEDKTSKEVVHYDLPYRPGPNWVYLFHDSDNVDKKKDWRADKLWKHSVWISYEVNRKNVQRIAFKISNQGHITNKF